MHQPATPTDLRLNDVKLHFEHWRASRVKREKIPDSLWLEVKTLLGRYSTSQITQTLGINAYQISSGVTHKNQFTFVSARPAVSFPQVCGKLRDYKRTIKPIINELKKLTGR